MQPQIFNHEAHRGGKHSSSCDRYEESHSNSFNRTVDCGNRPYIDRFPAPFRGSRTPFGFGSWGCGAPFRGGGPSLFSAPFLGRPPPLCVPPPCAPRGRPPYSFTPQRLQSPPPPYFGRAGYRGSCGGFNSSQCYQSPMANSNGPHVERCASPQGGGSKLTSPLAKTRDELLHQDENHTAPMKHKISAVGTKHLPERCTESDVCKLKHTLTSPTWPSASGNGSLAKRMKVHDSKNAARVHVCSDLSSGHASTSRRKTLDGNTAHIQVDFRGSGETGDKPNYCMNSVAKTSVPCTQARAKELAKGPPATAEASLHDRHCDTRGKNSNLCSPTHSADSQKCTSKVYAAYIHDVSPDSTTYPCPKLLRKESIGYISSSIGAALSLPQVASTSSGIACKEGPVTVNLLRSATKNYVCTKCLGEDAHRESLHCSANLCSGTFSTSRDDLRDVVVPVLSTLHDQIGEETETHIDNSCTPQQPSTDVATEFILNPLASFLESGGSGIAAVQKWLAVTSPCINSRDYGAECQEKDFQRDGAYATEEPQHSFDFNSAYALKKPEHENVSLKPSALLRDVVNCQMPAMSTTTRPILLQKKTGCTMSAASDRTGKIDSDQETASFISTESEDEDCVIVNCENFTHPPCRFQQCNDTANPRSLSCPSGSRLGSAHTPRPPSQASFAMSLEDVLFELDSYTALCVLDICEDPVAKKQVYTLYLKGMRTNAKTAYTEKMKKIACAAVERKRQVWKCSTGVLRKLAKLRWTFPQVGSVPRIRELYDFQKH
nr:uncharacterized protein LOC129381760 [Dermacentor andersoni]